MKSPKWDPVKSMYYDEQYPEWYDQMDWNNNGADDVIGKVELTWQERFAEEARQLDVASYKRAYNKARREHGLSIYGQ